MKVELFDIYLHELIVWNKKFNLTAITDLEEIKLKHFADSLTLLQAIKLSDEKVIDIGTGAGFPGIPLKLACPNISLTLLEATRKKVDFLKHIVKLLKLDKTEVIWARAEDYAKEQREAFDLAVARAVAKLPVLCEYCLPFVRVGGKFIAYKEAEVAAEITKANRVIKELGGKLLENKKTLIFGPQIVRSLVIIEKIKPTPLKYPRRAGQPQKKPL